MSGPLTTVDLCKVHCADLFTNIMIMSFKQLLSSHRLDSLIVSIPLILYALLIRVVVISNDLGFR